MIIIVAASLTVRLNSLRQDGVIKVLTQEQAHKRYNGKRDAFDRYTHIKYQACGIGNAKLMPERPVLIFTHMSAKPAELKRYGFVSTWRNSNQRVLQCESEQIALEAIDALSEHIHTVARYRLNDEHPFAWIRPQYNPEMDQFLKLTAELGVDQLAGEYSAIALTDDQAAWLLLKADVRVMRTLHKEAA
jgi:hypothetical protein